MENNLDNKTMSIQEVYRLYLAGKLKVNRRYQRKLVWSLEDKSKLVESISREYPLPLFLLAQDGKGSYEIIDGMQRLNAILSFIENEYPTVDGNYFDLDTLSDTLKLKEDGKITQKLPILDRDQCIKFTNYPLSVSIYRSNTADEIDEVFVRINSGGKRLSPQELRQAGVLGNFSDLVKEVAEVIRGDIAPNSILDLSDMGDLSLVDSPSKGINIADIFWIKQKIISKEELKASEDEYIITHILAYILLPDKEKIRVSNQSADLIYGRSSNEGDETKAKKLNTRLNDLIDKEGSDNIKNRFIHIQEIIKFICNEAGQPFHDFVKQTPNNCIREFISVSLTFYKLIFSENKKLKNSSGISQGIYNKMKSTNFDFTGGGKWAIKNQEENMSLVYDRVQEFFEPNPNPIVPSVSLSELEGLLSYSTTENDFYDFKQGLANVNTKTLESSIIDKIIQTVTAIHNIEPYKNGYIFIGIADEKKDAEKIESSYGIHALEFANKFVVGVDREAFLKGDMDKYYQYFIDTIKTSTKITDSMKSGLSYQNVLFRGKSIFVLSIKSGDKPEPYDNKFYKRVGSNNHEILGNQLVDFISNFK